MMILVSVEGLLYVSFFMCRESISTLALVCCISARAIGELAKKLGTSTSVIGRYERDEMTPSIEAAKKVAKFLNTTVGYLLGETAETNLLSDPDMLKRLNDIANLLSTDKEHILYYR